MNLEWFASRLEAASQGSGYILARCIFHNDNNPSLAVYQDTKRFYCYGCGKSGTWRYLESNILRRTHKTEIPKARRSKIRRVPGPAWPAGDLHRYCREAASRLIQFTEAHTYLRERGLGVGIRQFGLGWEGGWYIVPIRSFDGSIQGAVARAGPQRQLQGARRYDMPYGQRPMLYVPDLELYREADKVYLVFGVLDAISLAIAGLAGCSPTAGNQHLDVTWFDDILKPIMLVADKREERAMYKHASRMDWRGKVLVPDYRADEKDCNDILVKRGAAGLVEAVGG